jgi:hypothetical protein
MLKIALYGWKHGRTPKIEKLFGENGDTWIIVHVL